MRIKELIIKNFGKCSDEEIWLKDGLNLVYGENESGKSTIHTFIRAMLFGLERGRGRASLNDTFSQYEPWENPNYYSGVLKFESGGRNFRLERHFDKYARGAELICEDDGEELSVEQGDLEMLLLGMNGSSYDNTIASGQLKVETGPDLAAELKNYATNYYVTGDSDLDLNAAVLALQKKQKEAEKSAKESFRKKEEKREKAAQEAAYVWRDIHKLEEELEQAEKELAGVRRRIRKKEDEKRMEEDTAEERGRFRVHPVEILAAVVIIVLLFIRIIRPWNYLVGIVAALAEGLRVWNRMKDGRKKKMEYLETEEEKADRQAEKKLSWEAERIREEKREKQVLYGNIQESISELESLNEEEMRQDSHRKALELAAEKIGFLSKEIQKELSGHLNKKVSEIFSEMTDGKYTNVLVDEELNLLLFSEGKRISIRQVSQGTAEQLYFALRMAAAEVLYQEEYPVILDETFAFYDDCRLRNTLLWLLRHKKQVLLFTCQGREEEVLKSLGAEYHKIELSDGRIR